MFYERFARDEMSDYQARLAYHWGIRVGDLLMEASGFERDTLNSIALDLDVDLRAALDIFSASLLMGATEVDARFAQQQAINAAYARAEGRVNDLQKEAQGKRPSPSV